MPLVLNQSHFFTSRYIRNEYFVFCKSDECKIPSEYCHCISELHLEAKNISPAVVLPAANTEFQPFILIGGCLQPRSSVIIEIA